MTDWRRCGIDPNRVAEAIVGDAAPPPRVGITLEEARAAGLEGLPFESPLSRFARSLAPDVGIRPFRHVPTLFVDPETHRVRSAEEVERRYAASMDPEELRDTVPAPSNEETLELVDLLRRWLAQSDGRRNAALREETESVLRRFEE